MGRKSATTSRLDPGPLLPGQALDLMALFKTLANDTRLRMLHLLASRGELNVNELALALDLTPQAISNQLQRLVDKNIVRSRRQGTFIYYRLVDPTMTDLLDRGLDIAKKHVLRGRLLGKTQAWRGWNMNETKLTVLFLCTGNTARSQMAEAFLKRLGKDRFEVFSAGLAPREEIHPLAIEVMNEVGYDLKGQKPKALREFFGKLKADFVIFVCDRAEKDCPYLWPTALSALSWPVEDPSAFPGSRAAQLAKFREVRDQIESRIRAWLPETERDASSTGDRNA